MRCARCCFRACVLGPFAREAVTSSQTIRARAQAGTIISLVVSGIICIVWTLVAPAKVPWSWEKYKAIEVEDDENVRAPPMPLPCV